MLHLSQSGYPLYPHSHEKSYYMHCTLPPLTVTTCVGSSSSRNLRSWEMTTTDPSNFLRAAVSTCQNSWDVWGGLCLLAVWIDEFSSKQSVGNRSHINVAIMCNCTHCYDNTALFYSILFYSILFYTILLCSVYFYSTLYNSIPFYFILAFRVVRSRWLEGSSRRRRLWGTSTKEARATLAFSPPIFSIVR